MYDHSTLNDSAPAASLDAFDALQRGQDAPAWVKDGIRSAWMPEADSLEVALISVSENATFRVTRAAEPVMVVRLQRPGYVGDVANVRSELQWVDAIKNETEVRTPAPLRGTDGDLVQFIRASNGSLWTAVAFEFATGHILEDHDVLAPHFTEIGRISASLHEHSRAWSKPQGFTRFDWELDDMVGDAARWGSWKTAALSDADRTVVQQALDRALVALEPLSKTPQHWGLIHSDLRPSNLLIDGDGLTVIDFDDSGNSWYLYDFASALTFYEHRSAALDMAANWIAGYTSVLPLSSADRATAAALSTVRRLTMLGWATTHRADALPADLWEENLPGTVEVAARYVRDPLWLVDPS
jgi:Ser/Thr protein kinase RdoA (MazF antagonist)